MSLRVSPKLLHILHFPQLNVYLCGNKSPNKNSTTSPYEKGTTAGLNSRIFYHLFPYKTGILPRAHLYHSLFPLPIPTFPFLSISVSKSLINIKGFLFILASVDNFSGNTWLLTLPIVVSKTKILILWKWFHITGSCHLVFSWTFTFSFYFTFISWW